MIFLVNIFPVKKGNLNVTSNIVFGMYVCKNIDKYR